MSKIRDHKKWEQGRETYLYLQRMGFFNGYEIVGSDDKKECELCDRMQGKYVSLTDMTPLPPFHPNCRCKVVPRWKKVANLDEIYRYFYDPETGGICSHAGYEPTVDMVTDAVNYFLEQKYSVQANLTWKEIEWIGFLDENGNEYMGDSYDAEKMLGIKIKATDWNVFLENRLDNFRHYNPKTGEIKSGATKENILGALNSTLREDFGLRNDLTWEQVVWHGIYNSNKNKVNSLENVKDWGGYTTYLDMSSIINVDWGEDKRQEDTLDYWLNRAKDDGIYYASFDNNELYLPRETTSDSVLDQVLNKVNRTMQWAYWYFSPWRFTDLDERYIRNSSYAVLSMPNGEYDMKLMDDNVFGEMKSKTERQYQGYIYKGDFLRYDEPGNIAIGYLAYHIGLDLEYTLWAVDWVTRELYRAEDGDDKHDQELIKAGYNYAQTGVWEK